MVPMLHLEFATGIVVRATGAIAAGTSASQLL
jgi:hypothetical protein